jgi:hypothetical protein
MVLALLGLLGRFLGLRQRRLVAVIAEAKKPWEAPNGAGSMSLVGLSSTSVSHSELCRVTIEDAARAARRLFSLRIADLSLHNHGDTSNKAAGSSVVG